MAEATQPSSEVFAHDIVRIILWRHAGALVKKVWIVLEGQPLPKPYLGVPVSDEMAVFVALAGSCLSRKTVSLSIIDDCGIRILHSDRTQVRPLGQLCEYVSDSPGCKKLLIGILRNAPIQIKGWTKKHTAAFAAALLKLDNQNSLTDVDAANFAGAVEGLAQGLVYGWAMDRRRPFRTIEVDVFRGGLQVDRIGANLYRPELRTDGEGWGRHGFIFEPEVESEDDSPQVFEFRFAGSVLQLSGSPCRIVRGQLESQKSDRMQEISVVQPKMDFASLGDSAVRLAAGIDFVDGRRVIGWAVDPADPTRILNLRFEIDGVFAGAARADDPRDDLNCTGASRNHGFQVVLRTDALNRPWQQLFRLDVHDQDSGKLLVTGYPIQLQLYSSERENASFARRIERLEQTLEELREQLPHLRRRTAYALCDYDLWYEEVHRQSRAEFASDGVEEVVGETLSRISVLVPLGAEGNLRDFQRVLDSLQRQGERHQYLIVNQAQSDQAFEVLARSYVQRDRRFTWIDARDQSVPVFLRTVLGNTDSRYLLLLHSGESVSFDALEWMAHAGAKTGARIIYADSDRVDDSGAHSEPELRPDFNADLLLSTDYIGAYCVDRSLLAAIVGEIADEIDGVWQYDLLLRFMEQLESSEWLHIARVLTHRSLRTGIPEDNDDFFARSLRVLRSHLRRSALPAQAEIQFSLFDANTKLPRGAGNFAARLRWSVPDPSPKVSIIVPTRDEPDLVRTCIESIQQHTTYPDFEIVVVDHDTKDAEAQCYLASLNTHNGIRILHYAGGFNWSAINNLAVAHAEGEIICFLNNDTEVFSSDWLMEMVGHACRPEVGAVGAKLLHLDGTLQHGGVVLGVHGIAEHAFTGLKATEAGYLRRAALTQNLSAVTGACLVCRREVFESVGGFEMVNLGVVFNDIDFCLRLIEAGYRNVWTPHAQLYHLGSESRSEDNAGAQRARLDREIAYMHKRWASKIDRDPYYNAAFERHSHPYSLLTAAAYSPLLSIPS